MPRITEVAKAQQRYETKPVLSLHGTPIQTPVMGPDGEQKTTKFGRLIFRAATERDYSKPLPLLDCDYCREPIQIGTPYKHISPKSGPYGGRQLSRHASCPNWQVWDYSSSVSARAARIVHDFEQAISNATSYDDVETARDDAAAAAQELFEEKDESATNQEEHFGTSEIREVADALEAWVSEIESLDIPDFPEPEEQDCEDCGGEGQVDEKDCETCNGTGQVTPEEPTEEQLDDWLQEVQDNCQIESPV
jgi:hypothetical protein